MVEKTSPTYTPDCMGHFSGTRLHRQTSTTTNNRGTLRQPKSTPNCMPPRTLPPSRKHAPAPSPAPQTAHGATTSYRTNVMIVPISVGRSFRAWQALVLDLHSLAILDKRGEAEKRRHWDDFLDPAMPYSCRSITFAWLVIPVRPESAETTHFEAPFASGEV